jgi:hypothetical protein
MMKLFNQSIGRLCLTKTRSLIQASFMAVTLVALLASTGPALGQAAVPSDPFVILLEGRYESVAHGPDLGLSQVDMKDGTYWKVPIYGVSGIPGNRKEGKALGSFYVAIGHPELPVAYHVPGGSFTATFVGGDFIEIPDGEGGVFWDGTFELNILEATGIYRPFAGGHIHMVDILHITADGFFDEYCFCHVSKP